MTSKDKRKNNRSYDTHARLFILDEIWMQDKIYILVDTLLGLNILLIMVLAPKYKQHILPLSKVSLFSLLQNAD
jgi:hypothetical protein